MRTAILALCVSLGLIAILAMGTLFGFDMKIGPKKVKAPAQVEESQPVLVGRPAEIIEVPSGTFKGPTGQPSVRGPSGPPPNE